MVLFLLRCLLTDAALMFVGLLFGMFTMGRHPWNDLLIRLFSVLGVAGTLLLYLLIPVIWWLR